MLACNSGQMVLLHADPQIAATSLHRPVGCQRMNEYGHTRSAVLTSNKIKSWELNAGHKSILHNSSPRSQTVMDSSRL